MLHAIAVTWGHCSERLRYHIAGKEKRLVLRPYSEMSLAEARGKRDAARRHLREGLDPGL
ncbi:Arm DNA-binding domain-containing protein [Sphingomonas sp.]|uniref:Arm DNA-binding domain-containing protein n=1 Tax=Sphingomonas sp. TaxID=28214 RepID=UPI003AFFA456